MFPKPERKVDRKLIARIKAMPCASCGKSAPSDPSHIRTRGSGGPDTEWNIVPQCRVCHRTFEDGRYKFLMAHPTFLRRLEELGWRLEGFKLWHPELFP